jgi:hypothetical protein
MWQMVFVLLLTRLSGPGWKIALDPGPPTDNLAVTQLPFATHIHSTPDDGLATNRPDTCPGVVTL